MKILVTGSNGQLGKEVCELLKEKRIEYIAADRKTVDITQKELVNQFVISQKPDVIFHCAAYTDVEAAEKKEKNLNYSVNHIGSQNIAEAAKQIDATVVYISTDYVFDGKKEKFEGYSESDKVSPINEYGKAKLLGEKEIETILENHYIIRTSWVFGKYGNNFVLTMLRLAMNNEELKIVSDQVGRPTWTRSLAEFMLFLVQTNQEFGVYHFSNDQTCSWYEFSKEILKDKNLNILPVASSEFSQIAKRPKNSVMNIEKSKRTGFKIINWETALSKMLNNL